MANLKNTFVDSRLEKRKIDVLFSQAPIAISSGAVAALITLVLFWQSTNHIVLGTWFGFYLLCFSYRYFFIRQFNHVPEDNRDHDKALTRHIRWSVLVGLLWTGIGIYLLHTGELYTSIIVLMILGGLAAGSVATNAVKLSAYFAFILPAALPVALFMLIDDAAQLNYFGTIVLIFIAFISFSAYKLNKLVIQSLSYQFENLQLLRELEQEKNQVTRLYSNMEFDLARRKKTEEQLKQEKEKADELVQSLLAISTLDGLTGIPNRRHFDSVLAKEWNRASRAGTPISLIMCDIDDFKPYNDHYGHQKGDNCLIRVATLLQEYARRDGDMAARYGGEEFAIILPATSLESARDVAEQMRAGIENLAIPHRYSDADNVVTASFGVATIIPKREQQSRILVSKADKALYAAKKQGRNRVVTITPELIDDSGRDEDIVSNKS
jgi:diguanylate cyclase (GGDEF)-like protein